jgi:hypothetical protein
MEASTEEVKLPLEAEKLGSLSEDLFSWAYQKTSLNIDLSKYQRT